MTTANTTPAVTLTTKSNCASIKWTRHHDHDCAGRVYTAIVEIERPRESYMVIAFGVKSLISRVALRVDGREGTFRVDMKELSIGTPWEAIDGGTGFRTITEAKAFAVAWRAAVTKQDTLTPAGVPRVTLRRSLASEAVDLYAA